MCNIPHDLSNHNLDGALASEPEPHAFFACIRNLAPVDRDHIPSAHQGPLGRNNDLRGHIHKHIILKK